VAVCVNGAVIYDLHTETVLHEHAFPAELPRRLVDELRAALPGAVFACESGLEFAHEPAYTPHFALRSTAPVAEMDELLARPIVKVLVRHPTRSSAEMLALAEKSLGDLDLLGTFTFGGDDLLEISAPGVTKAFGLEGLASEHGVVASEVVAFGDMPNDLPMLAWAGHGVAVANAHPEVLAMADELTASNDDDGVALVVERLLGSADPAR
jgi:hydroxymethylpyrimidine pyrophosphatase-like HAD family hydrolase